MTSTIYHCSQGCSYTTAWLFAFNHHLRQCKKDPGKFSCENGPETYTCGSCKFETLLKVNYRFHNNLEKKLSLEKYKTFKCNRCKFHTSSKYILALHRMKIYCWSTKTTDGKMKCRVCNKIIKTRSAFKAHVLHIHSSYVNTRTFVQCTHCSYITRERRDLKNHMISKHTNPDQIKWFKCTQCSYQAKTRNVLENHIFRRHAEYDSQSSRCSCKAKGSSHAHIKFIHNDRTRTLILYKCDYCSFTSKYNNGIEYHLNAKHMDPSKIEWFPCELCTKKFKNKKLLSSHMNWKHIPIDEVKWYKCDQCNYKSRQKSVVMMHVKKHTRKEEFLCDKCAFKTHHKCHLNAHWQRKHLDKWYECEYCDHKTQYKSNLNKHYTRKHASPESIIWHECPHCDYKGKLKTNLKSHLLKHKMEK